MKLKCVESNVGWFTTDKVYETVKSARNKIVLNDDNHEPWYLNKTASKNYELTGLNDAFFEQID